MENLSWAIGYTGRKEKIMKMLRYDEEFVLDDELMGTIATYMDDEIRENLHVDLAPCDAGYFLRMYLVCDPEFAVLLRQEFGIEIEAGTTYLYTENNAYNEVLAVKDGQCYSCPVSSKGIDEMSGVDLYTVYDMARDEALIKAYGAKVADGTLYNFEDIERDFPDKIVDFDPTDYDLIVPIAEVD